MRRPSVSGLSIKKRALGNLPWFAGLLMSAAGCVSATNELPGVAALPRLVSRPRLSAATKMPIPKVPSTELNTGTRMSPGSMTRPEPKA